MTGFDIGVRTIAAEDIEETKREEERRHPLRTPGVLRRAGASSPLDPLLRDGVLVIAPGDGAARVGLVPAVKVTL
jgi:hypothetical protein